MLELIGSDERACSFSKLEHERLRAAFAVRLMPKGIPDATVCGIFNNSGVARVRRGWGNEILLIS
jgi:hypothetical protein